MLKGERELNAQTIFFGGGIVTMDETLPIAEALAIRDGKILAIDSKNAVLKLKGDDTRLVDLKGKTLMPGLIEPHSHPVSSAILYDWIDVSGFNNPNGEDVIAKLHEAVIEAKPGEWICAFGYDPILTRDLKALNIDILDNISSRNPIFVMVQTMHTVYVNSKAFELAGISKDTPQPEGGTFIKDGAGNLTGMVIEQGAIFPFMASILKDSKMRIRELMRLQIQRYASAGYTTVGIMGDFPGFTESMPLLKHLVEAEDSPVRMVLMEKATDLESGQTIDLGAATDRFRTTGVKFWYDGSPYTGNMYIDAPYLNSDLMQKGLGISQDTCGYPMLPKETLNELVQKYHDQGLQIAIHGQGDRAIREIIDVYEAVLERSPRINHRHRIEHGALYPKDQMERSFSLGLTLSWHINHIYYYGEALQNEIIGLERASGLMPMSAAQKIGFRNSLHNDSPMYPAEPFKLMRTAVTRKTRKGLVIGADQAISVEEALKAVTIDAAWQLFLEDKVGSIKVGKQADMVVLSENPCKIDPERFDQIQVIETYSDGRRFRF